jgi:hypothetical protein
VVQERLTNGFVGRRRLGSTTIIRVVKEGQSEVVFSYSGGWARGRIGGGARESTSASR